MQGIRGFGYHGFGRGFWGGLGLVSLGFYPFSYLGSSLYWPYPQASGLYSLYGSYPWTLWDGGYWPWTSLWW